MRLSRCHVSCPDWHFGSCQKRAFRPLFVIFFREKDPLVVLLGIGMCYALESMYSSEGVWAVLVLQHACRRAGRDAARWSLPDGPGGETRADARVGVPAHRGDDDQ